jgi:hypothetical protein
LPSPRRTKSNQTCPTRILVHLSYSYRRKIPVALPSFAATSTLKSVQDCLYRAQQLFVFSLQLSKIQLTLAQHVTCYEACMRSKPKPQHTGSTLCITPRGSGAPLSLNWLAPPVCKKYSRIQIKIQIFKFCSLPCLFSKYLKSALIQIQILQILYPNCSEKHDLPKYKFCFNFWTNKIWQ